MKNYSISSQIRFNYEIRLEMLLKFEFSENNVQFQFNPKR